jgi:hypothetical protein
MTYHFDIGNRSLCRHAFSRFCFFCLHLDTMFTMRLQEMWSSQQQSKFWASLIKIAREIDDAQTAVGRANDSQNKQFSMRVHALCALCLQLAFISISSFEYSLSLRLVDTAQRLGIGCPLPPRIFAWLITIKSRALSALSRSSDAAAELSALVRHKRLEAEPFLRSCVCQLLSAALISESHFVAALQAAKDAMQHARQATAAATCVQLYKKMTSSVRPNLHDVDVAALHAFASHNAAIASFLSGNLQAAEQYSRESVGAGKLSNSVSSKSLACFRATCNALASAGDVS